MTSRVVPHSFQVEENTNLIVEEMTQIQLDSLRDQSSNAIDFAKLRELICKASVSVRKSIMGLLSERETTQF